MDPRQIFEQFPAPSYQGYQQSALTKIKREFEAGNDIVLIQAPTGSGKSLLARAITGCAREKTDKTAGPTGAYYTSPQVSQIDDVAEDEFLSEINIIYGKSNYSCIRSAERGVAVTRARCSREPDWDCPEKDDCPYFRQRSSAQEGSIAGMTLAYFMEMSQADVFEKRDVIVVDEAHSLPQWAELYSSITVSPRTVPNWSDIRPEPQAINSIEDAHQYVSRLHGTLSEWLTKFQGMSNPSADDARLRDHLQKLVPDLQWFLKSYRDDEDTIEWVYEVENRGAVTLKPLHPQRFLKYALWERGDKIALLSATLLDKESFCSNIGLSPSKATLVDIPHSFPVENRPLYDVTQGKMTSEHREETLPKIAVAITQLMKKHQTEKGLVHCHSYAIKDGLVGRVGELTSSPDRIETHNRHDRDDSLQKWKQRNSNSVFFSVKMEEALDLKYDLCRWQALCKAPYKHTEDPIVQHRLQENNQWSWYHRSALRTIMQACGRVVRQPDDYGATYLLDSSILDVFERARSDMPQWFVDQVDRMKEPNLPPLNNAEQ